MAPRFSAGTSAGGPSGAAVGVGWRFGAAVGVSLLEFSQLRHPRLKFTNGRLAVVTADNWTRFEPMPDHARGPRLIGNGAAVFSRRRIWPSCRQQGHNKGKDESAEAWSERQARDPSSVRTLTRCMNGIRRHRAQSIFGLSNCCDRAACKGRTRRLSLGAVCANPSEAPLTSNAVTVPISMSFDLLITFVLLLECFE